MIQKENFKEEFYHLFKCINLKASFLDSQAIRFSNEFTFRVDEVLEENSRNAKNEVFEDLLEKIRLSKISNFDTLKGYIETSRRNNLYKGMNLGDVLAKSHGFNNDEDNDKK